MRSVNDEYIFLSKMYKNVQRKCSRNKIILIIYSVLCLLTAAFLPSILNISILLYLILNYLNFKLGSLFAINNRKISFLEDYSNLNTLDSILDSLSVKMGLTHQRINVWKSNHSSYLPSIQEDVGIFLSRDNTSKKEVNLFLPINFFMLLYTQPKHAEALIAHELGHVKHNDSNLWLSVTYFNHSFRKLIRISYFTFFLLDVPLSLVRLFDMHIPAIGMVIIAILYLVLFSILLFLDFISKTLKEDLDHARKLSEKLADLVVLKYSDGNALLECFSKYFSFEQDPSKYSPHLPIEKRIEYIKKFL